MKNKAIFSRILLIVSVCVLSLFFFSTYATAQFKATPEMFVGEWDGLFREYFSGASGSVSLKIYPQEGIFMPFSVVLSNASVPGFKGKAIFVDGKLWLDWPEKLKMDFFLHSDGDLEVKYTYKVNNSEGVWILHRVK